MKKFKIKRLPPNPFCLSNIFRWMYSVAVLLLSVTVVVVVLYVFPPWRMKAVADAAWSTGTAVVEVASKVVSEEQAAQKFLAQAAKSGRDMWAAFKDEANSDIETIGKGLPDPLIQIQ